MSLAASSLARKITTRPGRSPEGSNRSSKRRRSPSRSPPGLTAIRFRWPGGRTGSGISTVRGSGRNGCRPGAAPRTPARSPYPSTAGRDRFGIRDSEDVLLILPHDGRCSRALSFHLPGRVRQDHLQPGEAEAGKHGTATPESGNVARHGRRACFPVRYQELGDTPRHPGQAHPSRSRASRAAWSGRNAGRHNADSRNREPEGGRPAEVQAECAQGIAWRTPSPVPCANSADRRPVFSAGASRTGPPPCPAVRGGESCRRWIWAGCRGTRCCGDACSR